MWFIEKFSNYLDTQLSTFHYKETSEADQSHQKRYNFKLNENIKKRDELIEYLHDKLLCENYIVCNKREFSKLFSSTVAPPQPIIWCRDYIHLSFFIKCLSNKIIAKQKAPSHYEIAVQLFRNKDIDIPFAPAKIRHDKDPKSPEKEYIKNMIEYAEKTFIASTDSKRRNR